MKSRRVHQSSTIPWESFRTPHPIQRIRTVVCRLCDFGVTWQSHDNYGIIQFSFLAMLAEFGVEIGFLSKCQKNILLILPIAY